MAKDIASKVHSDMAKEDSLSSYLTDYYQQKGKDLKPQEEEEEEEEEKREGEQKSKAIPAKEDSVELKFLEKRTASWKADILSQEWAQAVSDLVFEIEVSQIYFK